MNSSRSPSSTAWTAELLSSGAVVVDLLVRLQHVRADLAAPLDLLAFALQALALGLAALLLEVPQLGLEHAHRRGLVLVLRALDLARDDDAGRQVAQAHRRVGLVDVLTAGAARAEGVDLEVGLVDLDVDLVLAEVGQRHHAGEAGLAARVGVERRDRTSRWTPISERR